MSCFADVEKSRGAAQPEMVGVAPPGHHPAPETSKAKAPAMTVTVSAVPKGVEAMEVDGASHSESGGGSKRGKKGAKSSRKAA